MMEYSPIGLWVHIHIHLINKSVELVDIETLWMYAFLPLLGGAIGGFVNVFWLDIKEKKESVLPMHAKWKYIFLGSISGFVAVCLLNPDGNFTAKAALSIIFGLSPMSFLKGQSFFNGGEEDDALSQYAESIEEYSETVFHNDLGDLLDGYIRIRRRQYRR